MVCKHCGGTGNDGSDMEMDCPHCDGFGEVMQYTGLAMGGLLLFMGAFTAIALVGFGA